MLALTVVPFLSLLRYLGTPWITNGVIVLLASGTIQSCTQKNLGSICACRDMSWERIENIFTNLRKGWKEEGREGLWTKPVCTQTWILWNRNNPRRGKKAGHGVRATGGCLCVFTLPPSHRAMKLCPDLQDDRRKAFRSFCIWYFLWSLSWKNRYKNVFLAKTSDPLPSFNPFCQKHNTNNSVLKNKALLNSDCRWRTWKPFLFWQVRLR